MTTLVVVTAVVVLLLAVHLWYLRRVRAAGEELRRSEEKYRVLVEHANDGIFVAQDGRFEFGNAKALELVGYDAKTLRGSSFADFIHPEDRAMVVERHFQRLKNEKPPESYPFRILRQDGSVRWVHLKTVRIDWEGRPATLNLLEDFTEKKAAQDALAEREEMYRSLVERANDGIMIIQDERIELCNSMFAGWVGCSKAEIEGRPFTEFVKEEDASLVLDRHRSRMAGRPVEGLLELELPRRGGGATDVEINAGLIQYRGAPANLAILRDITKRKQTIAELRNKRAEVDQIFKALPDAMIYTDTGRRILQVNPSFTRIFGWEAWEVLGRSTRFLHPDEDSFLEHGKLHYNREVTYVVDFYELVTRRKDGGTFLAEVVAAPVRDAEGKIAGLLSLVRDISGRREAEERIEHLNRVLHALREVTRWIGRETDPQRLTEAVCHILVTWRSYRAALIALQPQGEGMPFSVATAGEEAALERWVAKALNGEIRDWIGEGSGEDSSGGREDCLCSRIQHGSTLYGYVLVVRGRGHAVDEEERTLFCDMAADLAHALDAIAQGRAAVEARKEAAHLEKQFYMAQKLEAVGRLAGGIAHDFSNVVTVIELYVDLLESGLPETEPLRATTASVREACGRASRLTRQLLTFSRGQVLQVEHMNLNDLIEQMMNMLRPMVREDISIRFVPAEGLERIKANPGQIEQVVMNLVVNARDAMPDGGEIVIETRSVELDEEYAARHVGVRPGAYVMLAVSDTGSGIPKEVMGRIFEPFFTTKKPGFGTGLGLSTVYGIVKQSGGNIWAYSEPGQGTTFKVYLPQTAEGEAVRRTENQPLEFYGSETILLVENEEWLLELVEYMLKVAGYKVLAAGSGEEALRVAEEFGGPVDLLLTDVVMPGLSGQETAERFKERYPEAKVLYMSGYSEEIVFRGNGEGEKTLFISKPFTAAELARKLREVLGEVP
ncbi:PAS domain S-box protein [Desulfatiglans anilini]|uniref:PAS domain S-box protein n=1 Tax=Desulfatiglans anilini TaxID=90728 RepID=UPI00042631B1|nr:PAS domain S-box protein [Desulfatiglans anilini]